MPDQRANNPRVVKYGEINQSTRVRLAKNYDKGYKGAGYRNTFPEKFFKGRRISITSEEKEGGFDHLRWEIGNGLHKDTPNRSSRWEDVKPSKSYQRAILSSPKSGGVKKVKPPQIIRRFPPR